MSLLSIVTSSALLALVVGTTSQYLRFSSASQANLAKAGEAAELDLNVRTLLSNGKACVETAKGFDLENFEEQPIAILDGAGNTVFSEGTEINSVFFEKLTATVQPADDGVHSVRVDVKLTKRGAPMGRASYDHSIFLNVVVDPSGSAIRCFQKGEAQGVFQLVAVDEIALQTTAKDEPRLAIACGAPNPFDPSWGHVVDGGLFPCTGFAAFGAPTTFVAKGNYIGLNLQGRVFVGPLGNSQAVDGVGAVGSLLLTGNGVSKVIPFGAEVTTTTGVNGFQAGMHSSPSLLYSVVAGETYQLKSRVIGNLAAGTGPFLAGITRFDGSISHYLKGGP